MLQRPQFSTFWWPFCHFSSENVTFSKKKTIMSAILSAILATILSNILLFGFQDNHQIVLFISNAKICRCVMSNLIFMQLKGKFSEITLSQPFVRHFGQILAAILSAILIFGFHDNHLIVFFISNAKICRCVMINLIFTQLKGKCSEITLSPPF